MYTYTAPSPGGERSASRSKSLAPVAFGYENQPQQPPPQQQYQQQQQQQQDWHHQQQWQQQQQPQASVPMGAYAGAPQQQQEWHQQQWQQQEWQPPQQQQQQPSQQQQQQQQQQHWQYAPPAGQMQPAACSGQMQAQPGASFSGAADGYSGQMGGALNGQMGPPEPPKGADNSFIPRNISATLLGQGETDEKPILEELDINFEHIVQKTRAVMWPRRSKLDAAVINDSDFAGPILFALLLGTLLLFNGKVQFGYIYGVFVVGLLGLWSLLNLMSDRGIDIYRTASVMGYCLLPIVALAALSIPLELRGWVGALFIPLAVCWCTAASSLFFVISLEADDRRWLVAYPVALFYTCFALITIF